MNGLTVQPKSIRAGALAGLIAGLVFGVVMSKMGILPMVAKLVNSSSASVGLGVHIVISIIIGIIFAFVLGSKALNLPTAVLFGLIYGAIWWVLGPLIFMPVLLKMGPQLTSAAMIGALPSLWGHLIYGFILGPAYVVFSSKF